ncbi:hypothetical protein L798_04155 [Zootermopsis nevadensis]|uniref:Uncharacterized protein n=1 Tax=Zootermopsis nevadensis TaxID=136037 RepID=A0A067RED5_ZOONE|nr:hypothetical protein L798_04155 [Zootermopsis nevadensis]
MASTNSQPRRTSRRMLGNERLVSQTWPNTVGRSSPWKQLFSYTANSTNAGNNGRVHTPRRYKLTASRNINTERM